MKYTKIKIRFTDKDGSLGKTATKTLYNDSYDMYEKIVAYAAKLHKQRLLDDALIAQLMQETPYK